MTDESSRKSKEDLSFAHDRFLCSDRSFKSEIIIKNEGLNKEYTANNSRLLSQIGQFKFTSYSNGINKLYKQKMNNS